jgi:transposase-like protein
MEAMRESMEIYPRTAAERAMKLHEVLLRASAGKIKWWQAAELMGISSRQLRRWRKRLEEQGHKGLLDPLKADWRSLDRNEERLLKSETVSSQSELEGGHREEFQVVRRDRASFRCRRLARLLLLGPRSRAHRCGRVLRCPTGFRPRPMSAPLHLRARRGRGRLASRR